MHVMLKYQTTYAEHKYIVELTALDINLPK